MVTPFHHTCGRYSFNKKQESSFIKSMILVDVILSYIYHDARYQGIPVDVKLLKLKQRKGRKNQALNNNNKNAFYI